MSSTKITLLCIVAELLVSYNDENIYLFDSYSRYVIIILGKTDFKDQWNILCIEFINIEFLDLS